MEAVLILIVIFGFPAALLYVLMITKHRERMLSLIGKDADPTLFNSKMVDIRIGKTLGLKTGLFFVGIAIGVVFGNILDVNTYLHEATAYTSMIFLFGGLGLVSGHWVRSPKEKQ